MRGSKVSHHLVLLLLVELQLRLASSTCLLLIITVQSVVMIMLLIVVMLIVVLVACCGIELAILVVVMLLVVVLVVVVVVALLCRCVRLVNVVLPRSVECGRARWSRMTGAAAAISLRLATIDKQSLMALNRDRLQWDKRTDLHKAPVGAIDCQF